MLAASGGRDWNRQASTMQQVEERDEPWLHVLDGPRRAVLVCTSRGVQVLVWCVYVDIEFPDPAVSWDLCLPSSSPGSVLRNV
jgi:hypothetical protein